ncbi:Origin recognition complex, subunit 1 [Elasticomyces elasticus]|nr:Origin recognition complex, subunit 1 [Elasticomyces elasticus]
MAGKRKRSAKDIARQYLYNGGKEDLEDEPGVEDREWEWIYDGHDKAGEDVEGGDTPSPEKRTIIGARKGTFSCNVGDTVVLETDTTEAWVGIIRYFFDGEIDGVEQKLANFMWFSSENEILKGPKKRTDFLPNERYITAAFDDNSVQTIDGHATVVSATAYAARFPNGKVPKSSKDYGKIFICRRGCNTRNTIYTEEFVWEDVYHGEDDLRALTELVESQTAKTRKRKAPSKIQKDLDGFVLDDEDFGDTATPRTPKKRRKVTSATPTPSKLKLTPTTARKFMTPTHRRLKKPLEFTPLGTRVLSPSHTTASPHQLARTQLHVSAVPSALPCREEEFAMVYSHLEQAISAGTGSCIYISGTPGTGKTATVREVVAALHESVLADELDGFVFVEINGMKVTDPHQSYALLWEALKGERVSPSHALELLNREFERPNPRRVPCVVLMDELDQLVTKNQGVMYNFFNWPQLAHSRLIVLAVANTMDLPERTLSNKISSRLGLTRITFPGYTHQQLMKIIESRLQNVPGTVVESDAVQFAARKVAAVSGDARRALDICRRAVEIAEQEDLAAAERDAAPGTPSKTPGRQKPSGIVGINAAVKRGIVTIATVKRAINEATSTPLAAYLRSLPLASKLFLAALLARLRRTGIGEAVIGDVVEEARRMGLTSQLEPIKEFLLALDGGGGGAQDKIDGVAVGIPSRRGRPVVKRKIEQAARVLRMGVASMELAEAGIIGLESRRGERVGRVRLGVSEEDVRGALRDDEECKGLGFAG